MTFKIGDKVIMTADKEKGLVLSWCGVSYYRQLMMTNGDYNGRIIKIGEDGILVNYKWGPSFDVLYFNLDGSCSTHPGMSIRPVNYVPGQIPIEKPTPSQWIEGQIPKTEIGKLFHVLCNNGEIRQVYRPNEYTQNHMMPDGKWEEYTHYCLAKLELPPPPPVKEVEAFGILEAIKNTYGTSDFNVNKLYAFYSQPATAENLRKYFKCGLSADKDYNCTLDQFIGYHKEALSHQIIFTPAALDMLGVK